MSDPLEDYLASKAGPSTTEAIVRGGIQGGTGGWSDEAVGGVKGGLARIVGGLKNIGHSINPEVPASTVDPMDVYRRERDLERGKNAAAQEAHPGAYALSQAGGALALPAARSVAGMAALGGLSGYGLSDAPAGSEQSLKDTAIGAGTGLVGGLTAKGVTGLAKGAAQRVEDRALGSLKEGVANKVANRVTKETDRIKEVVREPAFAKAMGNPERLQAATAAGFAKDGPLADRILATADKGAAAKVGSHGLGGMTRTDVVGPLRTLESDLMAHSESPAAINAVRGVIDQFESGFGRDPNAPIPAANVREFLTRQIQRPAFKGDPAAADTLPKQEALQRAAGAVKEALLGHVEKNGGNVPMLQKLWDRMTAYSAIEGAAEQQAYRAAREPSGLGGALKALMGHGGGTGAMIGGAIGGVPGAVAGAALGKGLPMAAAGADRVLATPAGQAAAGNVARAGARALPQPLINALVSKDDEAGKRALADHFFADPRLLQTGTP